MEQTNPGFELLLKQFYIILQYLERPFVRRQLIVFVTVILLAWLLSYGLLFVGKKLLAGRQPQSARWLRYWRWAGWVIKLTTFPLLTIVAVNSATRLLLSEEFTPVILLVSLGFLVVFLFYRLFVAWLYIMFDEAVIRRYHYRLLLPLFLFFIVLQPLSLVLLIDGIERIELWTLFQNPITLGELFNSVIGLYFLFNIAWALQYMLQIFLTDYTNANTGVVHAGLTISSYVIIGVGILMIFDALGLDVTTLTFITGGLSIGIGFGLQQVVGNFISGILILFEQSLRPQDVISINGSMAIVDDLNIRSTTVRTLDNVEVIVPNETFLTSAVTNYTKTNPLLRVLLTVGASYDSNPKEVRQILKKVAEKHPDVQEEPKAEVFLIEFADSSINFQLAVWLDNPTLIKRVNSELHLMIWEAFEENNIEMPYPQRDLHIRSSSVPLTNITDDSPPSPSHQSPVLGKTTAN